MTNVTAEELNKVITLLSTDEAWSKVSPEIQKSVLDDLHHEIADDILEQKIQEVQKEGKKSRRKRAVKKSEPEEGSQ